MSRIVALALCWGLVVHVGCSGGDDLEPHVANMGESALVFRPGFSETVQLQVLNGVLSTRLESEPLGAFEVRTFRDTDRPRPENRSFIIHAAANAPPTAKGKFRVSVDGGNAVTITLSIEPPRPYLTLDGVAPRLIADVGQTVEGRFRVQNTGTADLELNGIVLDGIVPGLSIIIAGHDVVTRAGTTTFAEPYVVAPGEVLFIEARYTAATLDDYQQLFTLVTNLPTIDDLETTHGVFLLNENTCLSADTSVDFGDVQLDTVGLADLTVRPCEGDAFAWIDAITIDGDDVSQAEPVELPLVVREPTVLSFVYRPRNEGTLRATVRLRSQRSTIDVRLDGRGVR